jgi:hypothetical protein
METRHESLAYSDQDFAHLNLLHRDRKAVACCSTQLHFGAGSWRAIDSYIGRPSLGSNLIRRQRNAGGCWRRPFWCGHLSRHQPWPLFLYQSICPISHHETSSRTKCGSTHWLSWIPSWIIHHAWKITHSARKHRQNVATGWTLHWSSRRVCWVSSPRCSWLQHQRPRSPPFVMLAKLCSGPLFRTPKWYVIVLAWTSWD